MLGAMAKAETKPSALIDTRVIYCGDNLNQLRKFPDGCVDLIYIDPPFNSNRNYEVFWGETKEKRSFYYQCDWHASHYVKVMLDQIFGDEQFQTEIIWQRAYSHGNVSRSY